MTTFGRTGKIDLLAKQTESLRLSVVSWPITSFSEDIIGNIATFGGLEATIRLFCTGSLLLRQKLSSPQCRVLLRHSFGAKREPQPLPPFISDLKGIVGISLVSPFSSGNEPSEFCGSWSLLPSSIATLQCSCMNAFNFGYYLSPNQLQSLTSLSLSEGEPKKLLEPVLAFLCDGSMNQLRVLSLSLPLMSICDLTSFALPNELESLSLHNFAGEFSLSAISHLEHLRNLEIPHFQKIKLHEEGLSVLASLKALNIRQCKFIMSGEAAPKGKLAQATHETHIRTFFFALCSLSNLVVSAAMVSDLIQATTDTGLPAFWNSLTSLSILDGDVVRAFPLPSNLLSLRLQAPMLAFPERLPRSILSLAVPATQLLAPTLPGLPPKLCQLFFSPVEMDTPPGSGIIPFPPSITRLVAKSSDRPPHRILPKGAEEEFVRRLPESIIVYEGIVNHHYIRLPESLRKKHEAACVEGTSFAEISFALKQGDLELVEYLIDFWNQDVEIDIAVLSEAIENEDLDVLEWLIRHYCFKSGPLPSSICAYLAAGSLRATQRLKILQIILTESKCPPTFLSRPEFILAAIQCGNSSLLEWIARLGVNDWDRLEETGTSLLNHALDLDRNSDSIFHFLLRHGAKSVDIADILSKCLRDQSVSRLERLREYSKVQKLECKADPGNEFHIRIFSIRDPSYLINIFEWLKDPANGFLAQFKLEWIASLVPVICHRYLQQLISLTKDKDDKDSETASEYLEHELITSQLRQIDTIRLKKIRLLTQHCDTISTQMIVMLLYFVEHGFNLFDYGRYSCAIVDVGFVLNSMRLVQFFATLPGSNEILIQSSEKWDLPPSISDYLIDLALRGPPTPEMILQTKQKFLANRIFANSEHTMPLFNYSPSRDAANSSQSDAKPTFGKSGAGFGTTAPKTGPAWPTPTRFGQTASQGQSLNSSTVLKSSDYKPTSYGFSTQSSHTRTFGSTSSTKPFGAPKTPPP